VNYRILVMAKAPIPGTVKTCLELPPRTAPDLQAALIAHTAEKSRSLAPTTVAGAPPNGLDLVRVLLPEDVDLIPQPSGDLGDRMLAGVETLFAASPDPVLVLGTDAPTLPAVAIEGAASALDTHDISIIPSKDGGYVLLGLRRPEKAVFRGVEWSTGAVFRQTLRRAEAAGLSVHVGEPSYDVDEPEDLGRLMEEFGAHPGRAPRTADFLRRL
jgi:rSAM/selenodomain-associated transferase 1